MPKIIAIVACLAVLLPAAAGAVDVETLEIELPGPVQDWPPIVACGSGRFFALKLLTSREYGSIIALNGLLIVVFQIPLTTFLGRFDRGVVMAAGAAFNAIGTVTALPSRCARAFAFFFLLACSLYIPLRMPSSTPSGMAGISLVSSLCRVR